MATVASAPETLSTLRTGKRFGTTLSEPERERRLLRHCALALLAFGVGWRGLRYLMAFPIWGDEAMIGLNLLRLDFAGLTGPLEHCQVAPLLFLWAERAVLCLLGGSELAARLLPFLAGMGALFLYWRLVRLTLEPLAATLALGFLAVAIWPVSMAACLKPYATDLFLSLALLLPAAYRLQRPGRLRWLVVLILVAPVAILGSFPAVFVAAAVSLALLPGVWRQRRVWAWLLFALFNVAVAASFLGHYLLVGRNQLQSPFADTTTALFMRSYWADGFPPSSPLALVWWLLMAHTGQMTAYPIGASSGGSVLTTLLCLTGAWHWWRSGRRALLVLCLAPFPLMLLASVLGRYPYGASCRLCQHVAPAVCLTAGLGAAVLVGRVRSAALRRRWIVAAFCGFLAVGVGGVIRDLARPYRNIETLWTRTVMQRLLAEIRSGAPIVLLNRPDEVDPLLLWHLEVGGKRVAWEGRIDWEQATAAGQLVCLHFWRHRLAGPAEMPRACTRQPAAVPADLQDRVRHAGAGWSLEEAVTDTDIPPRWKNRVHHLDQFRWVLAVDGGAQRSDSR